MKIKFIIFLFLCLIVFGAIAQSSQEEKITITTYYPSPYGVYNQLVTRTLGVGDTNNNNQLDSRDAPNPNTNAGDVYISGRVGIGTNNPTEKLDVRGRVRFGEYTFPDTNGLNGQTLINNGLGQLSWGRVGPIFVRRTAIPVRNDSNNDEAIYLNVNSSNASIPIDAGAVLLEVTLNAGGSTPVWKPKFYCHNSTSPTFVVAGSNVTMQVVCPLDGSGGFYYNFTGTHSVQIGNETYPSNQIRVIGYYY